MFDLKVHSHKRLNPLTGDWVLVSPHRMKRPWQGKTENVGKDERPEYDAACYLCPGNKRAEGAVNPSYNQPYVFENDFAALLSTAPAGDFNENNLLVAQGERGICKVICFSPKHNLTLPQMDIEDIESVIDVWQEEYRQMAAQSWIKYIQIFENKGDVMGCSNPHPHGQVWASSSVPAEIIKETIQQKKYFETHGTSLLSDYVKLEIQLQDRVIANNEHFIALVPFWAVWPYEIMIVCKRHVQHINQFIKAEQHDLAEILKMVTVRYDNLFNISFPYSAGMHQAPVNSGEQQAWHWHMHFYPPLLRSASVKKFMVGYEMLANPQRDITPEQAAETLKGLSNEHYSINKNI